MFLVPCKGYQEDMRIARKVVSRTVVRRAEAVLWLVIRHDPRVRAAWLYPAHNI